VWVWDRTKASLTRVSVSPTGDPGDGKSQVADISLDGRFVLFTSAAANLVSGDTNGQRDAFVRDMRTSTTQLVSLTSTGKQLGDGVGAHSLTEDGHVVFFSTRSQAVPADRNTHQDVYARNLATGATSLVSRNSHGRIGNGTSLDAWASDNGRWVAFRSRSTNLASGDREADQDVFLRNLHTGHTRLISVKPAGLARMKVLELGGISGDGQVVVFQGVGESGPPEFAGSLLPFVYQRATGKVDSPLGNLPLGGSFGEGSVNSLHGNLVTIGTDAALTRGDTRRFGEDVYLLRLSTGRFTLLTPQNPPTRDHTGTASWSQMLSRDGHVLLFETAAQYTSADSDHDFDAYLRHLP
jgi:hypothetical protein